MKCSTCGLSINERKVFQEKKLKNVNNFLLIFNMRKVRI